MANEGDKNNETKQAAGQVNAKFKAIPPGDARGNGGADFQGQQLPALEEPTEVTKETGPPPPFSVQQDAPVPLAADSPTFDATPTVSAAPEPTTPQPTAVPVMPMAAAVPAVEIAVTPQVKSSIVAGAIGILMGVVLVLVTHICSSIVFSTISSNLTRGDLLRIFGAEETVRGIFPTLLTNSAFGGHTNFTMEMYFIKGSGSFGFWYAGGPLIGLIIAIIVGALIWSQCRLVRGASIWGAPVGMLVSSYATLCIIFAVNLGSFEKSLQANGDYIRPFLNLALYSLVAVFVAAAASKQQHVPVLEWLKRNRTYWLPGLLTASVPATVVVVITVVVVPLVGIPKLGFTGALALMLAMFGSLVLNVTGLVFGAPIYDFQSNTQTLWGQGGWSVVVLVFAAILLVKLGAFVRQRVRLVNSNLILIGADIAAYALVGLLGFLAFGVTATATTVGTQTAGVSGLVIVITTLVGAVVVLGHAYVLPIFLGAIPALASLENRIAVSKFGRSIFAFANRLLPFARAESGGVASATVAQNNSSMTPSLPADSAPATAVTPDLVPTVETATTVLPVVPTLQTESEAPALSPVPTTIVPSGMVPDLPPPPPAGVEMAGANIGTEHGEDAPPPPPPNARTAVPAVTAALPVVGGTVSPMSETYPQVPPQVATMSTVVPLKTAQETAKQRRLAVIIGSTFGGLLLLVIGGLVAVNVINSSYYSAQATVEAYWKAISEGKGTDASAMEVEPAASPLISNAVYTKAKDRPKVISVRDAGAVATETDKPLTQEKTDEVPQRFVVTYQMKGLTYTVQTDVVHADKQGVFFENWKVRSKTVADVEVQGSAAIINGVTAVEAGKYFAYPGTYTVAAKTVPQYLKSVPKATEIKLGEEAKLVAGLSVSDEGKEAVLAQIKKFLQGCAKITTSDNTYCGGTLSVFREYDYNISWTMPKDAGEIVFQPEMTVPLEYESDNGNTVGVVIFNAKDPLTVIGKATPKTQESFFPLSEIKNELKVPLGGSIKIDNSGKATIDVHMGFHD